MCRIPIEIFRFSSEYSQISYPILQILKRSYALPFLSFGKMQKAEGLIAKT